MKYPAKILAGLTILSLSLFTMPGSASAITCGFGSDIGGGAKVFESSEESEPESAPMPELVSGSDGAL